MYSTQLLPLDNNVGILFCVPVYLSALCIKYDKKVFIKLCVYNVHLIVIFFFEIFERKCLDRSLVKY